MKVIISVLGRFHGFDLAREVQSQGYLHQLISSYPGFVAKRFGIDKTNYQSFLYWELLARGLRKGRCLYAKYWNEQFLIADGYDRSVAKALRPGADIFVGWSSSSLHSLRAAKRLGMKTVLERGSAHIETQQQILTEEYERQGLKFSETDSRIIETELREYQEADYISVPSFFVRDSFLAHGIPRAKLIHVPYGVDLSQFNSQLTVAPTLNKFRVIFCGSASLRKGVYYLLQALDALAISDIELWMVGSIAAEVKVLLSKKWKINIRVVGKVLQSELKNYYSQCSVFCLPSVEEGLAMVIPQAMACGLPVICTENTGGKDIVREGVDGFIIPIRDVEKLKEKILFFYKNRQVAIEMGRNATQHVQGLFTWKDYGQKMVSEYSRILTR